MEDKMKIDVQWIIVRGKKWSELLKIENEFKINF